MATLLLAIALPVSLAVVSESPGIHSALGMRLMLVGLPGTVIGVWTQTIFGDVRPLFFVATALANWTFYLCVAKGVILLKERIRRFRQPS